MAEGRRRRVREKVEKAGIQILADHEKLEFMIYPYLPRRDTVPIARALLAKFGSVDGVFNASYEDLITVKGMPRLAARTFSVLRSIVSEKCLLCPDTVVGNAVKAAELALSMYRACPKESLYAFCLDKDSVLLNLVCVWRDEIPFEDLRASDIIADMVRAGSDILVLVRCGAGAPIFYEEDEDLIFELRRAFDNLSFALWDYVVLSDTGDFRACRYDGSGLLRQYFDDSVDYD